MQIDASHFQHFIATVADSSGRVQIKPETVEQDMARLILGLMEFLRQIMEGQAIRRMDAGVLTDEEEERLGLTLMRAQSAIHDAARKFGISPGDLALDLGPLGKTI
ncbi:MAG: gas vesicle protein K [Pseudomonadota bacterium]